MLKWFRQYNKVILAVGCAVLMVAFLVPQAVTMFAPSGGGGTVGEAFGRTLTTADRNLARFEMRALSQLNLLPVLDVEASEADTQVMLMKAEADQLGLHVSNAELNEAVRLSGYDDAFFRRFFGGEQRQPEALGRATLRTGLLLERYRRLMTGRTPNPRDGLLGAPGLELLRQTGQIQEQLRSLTEQSEAAPFLLQQVQQQANRYLIEVLEGYGRLPVPAVQSALAESATTLAGELVTVEAVATDADRDAVTEAQVQELFDTYRTVAPGGEGPLPFSYRLPDRVAVEALLIPSAAVRESVEVPYVDVVRRFREQNDGNGMPTAQQRDELAEELRTQRAQTKTQQILSELSGLFEADTRGLERERGYLVLPEGFEPTPMERAAEQIEERFGVSPRVIRSNGPEPLSDLLRLEGLGTAVTQLGAGQRSLPFLLLVNDLRALIEDRPRSGLRLQEDVVASLPLEDADGNRLVWRATEVLPAADATELTDEVRERVEADAARLNAFRRLAERVEELRGVVASEGAEQAAEAFGGAVQPVGPLPRRAIDGQPPLLPGLGRAAALTDAAFEAVSELEPGEDPATALSMLERVVAEAVEPRLSIAALRVDSFQTPTFEQATAPMRQPSNLRPELRTLGPVEPENRPESPLSLSALMARSGFQLESQEADPDGLEPQSD